MRKRRAVKRDVLADPIYNCKENKEKIKGRKIVFLTEIEISLFFV